MIPEKLNMSQSFYNYIVEELLFGYFKKNMPKKGSRYFLIVENEEHRNHLMDALEVACESITISGIYQGNNSSVLEEKYVTHMFKPSVEAPSIIIGYDKTSTEDYLTTIRNSVGVVGNKYEDYGVIYILSDSILSSIITACQDLQGEGGPLHYSYIIKNIQEKAEEKIVKDLERQYLAKHLSKISEYIADGTCTLFDFQNALDVLADGSLKNHYNALDSFNDKALYEGVFRPSDAEIKARVDKNYEIYQKVSDIMNEDNDADREKNLSKFLDEKLSKKLVRDENWQSIDIQEFLNSIERKAATAKLELLNIQLSNEGNMSSLVYLIKGKPKKSSKSYIVVCDETGAKYKQVDITFNKEIKKVSAENCKAQGQILKVIIGDKLVRHSIGLSDNHHDFFMLKLPCNESFFKDIKNCFSINKRGEIEVAVPEETEKLTFGSGTDVLSLPLDGKVEWTDNVQLEIPIEADDDNEKIVFDVDFGSKQIKIVLKLNVAKPIPPAKPGTIIGTYAGGNVIVDENPRAVYSYWKRFLDWEYSFISNKCSFISYVRNDLTYEHEAIYEKLSLPTKVSDALNGLYDYFREHETIPSLCLMNDELRVLYKAYWKTIIECIEKIPNSRSMSREEYLLTKVGIVSDWDRYYISPFHPLLVAYALEYDSQYDKVEDSSFAKKLLSPFYLLPYIYINNNSLRPYTDKEMSEIHNWLSYEGVNSKPQQRTNDITTKMVWTKMIAFIRYFKYLFQDKECPIILSTIGITDDTNVIKGILEFIKKEYGNGVQRIELHEYVDNLMEETFFEKLNRLDTIDAIARELEAAGVRIESKGEYTSQEMIHQLFTRMSFYKHCLKECNDKIGYSHIAFYQMNTGTEFIRQATKELRTELSFNGLISIPSTTKKSGAYIIGYGTGGLKETEGYIYPMSSALNSLYASEENEGSNLFTIDACVAKRYKFDKSELLNSIYDNANWVTFINPEVDINFFYQQNLYVVHYTDQYTINAKYDSITVTKHVDQYENMLRKSYEKYALSEERFQHFNKTMMDYFNCLNGSWMLSIVNKTEDQIREKMSIVAACVAMLRFMKRNKNVHWIPVSLDEILRVTGSIELPLESFFSKKTLGVSGAMSDDLLMIGLDLTDENNLKLYLYPIEVKFSKYSSMADKAGKQVSKTFLQFKEHIFGTGNFTKNIYRTFFASQFLTNAEKLNANNLLTDEEYNKIENFRFELLNLKYSLEEKLPVKEMGNAAIVSFYSHASHSLSTSLIDYVPICEVHFSEQECFQFVANPESHHLDFLATSAIFIDNETLNAINNPIVLPQGVEDAIIELTDTFDDDANDDDKVQEQPKNSDNSITISPAVEATETIITPKKTYNIKIKVGHTQSGNREIVFEPNNTKMVSHPNMGIIGTMGTGKTQFARSVIAQFAKESIHNIGGNPVGMLVFDYKGDYKDAEFLDAVGGTCYKFNYPFNPLKLVVNDEVEGMNLPAITADRIADSFAKAYGLGLKQQSNIKQVIIDTYNDAGITKNPDTWNNPVPTMEQVIDKYFETYDSNDKAFALFDKLRDYTIFTTDNSNCVSLFEWLNSVRVIDLTLYPDDTKKVIVSLILDLFYAEMRQLGGSKQENGYRELRAMIMVDEAHQFLKKDFNSFRSIISEGRMFGVGMILSTQNLGDFKTSKEDYSQFILSWVIHHVNSISKSEIANIFGASDQNADRYMDFINRAKIFESVCKIGSRVEGIRDLPFFELMQSDNRFQ